MPGRAVTSSGGPDDESQSRPRDPRRMRAGWLRLLHAAEHAISVQGQVAAVHLSTEVPWMS